MFTGVYNLLLQNCLNGEYLPSFSLVRFIRTNNKLYFWTMLYIFILKTYIAFYEKFNLFFSLLDFRALMNLDTCFGTHQTYSSYTYFKISVTGGLFTNTQVAFLPGYQIMPMGSTFNPLGSLQPSFRPF